MNLKPLIMATGLALVATGSAAAQTLLDRAVISAGGGAASSASTRLDATIAQPSIGIATNGQTVGQFGFWTASSGVVLSARETGAGAITAMRVAPNPAAAATRVSLTLASASSVEVSLHDATGRTIATHSLGRLPAGEHVVPVELGGLASGSYSLVASVDGALLRTAVTVVR